LELEWWGQENRFRRLQLREEGGSSGASRIVVGQGDGPHQKKTDKRGWRELLSGATRRVKTEEGLDLAAEEEKVGKKTK